MAKSRTFSRSGAPGNPPDRAPAGTENRAEPNRAGAGSKPAPGLYIVPTPIGNLQDITLRALDILQSVELIACEDTRVTGHLLDAHGITTPVTPYHEHNAPRVRPQLLRRLKAGASIALVSDAGTPTISDPGYRLVSEAAAADVPVVALPGASAVITALAASALPTDRFLFMGFLPSRATARRRALEEIAAVRASLVLFESPRRLAGCLADLAQVLGDRDAAIARELTKRFEEIRRAPLSALAQDYARNGPPKGEVVIVVAPPGDAAPPSEDAIDALLRDALGDHSLRDAVDLVTAKTGVPRRTVYARALSLDDERWP